MYKNRCVLAVVPARGGSKGVRLKNLRTIGGVSLIALVGRVVAQLDYIDRAIVSTDHQEIASAAVTAGLDAPFFRPQSLSGDRISDWQVLSHALETVERLDGNMYDIVLMLQPTAPLRRPEQVTRTVAKLIEGAFDAVWTVSETDAKSHPLKQLTLDDQGSLDYYDLAGAEIIARQQLRPVYHRNGIAYAMTRDCLIRHGNIKGDKAGAVVIEGPVANIDSELDLAFAEFLADRVCSDGYFSAEPV